MESGAGSAASPSARRQAELAHQLSLVEMTVLGEGSSAWLEKLAPIVRDGAKKQRKRLKQLPSDISQRWAMLSDIAALAEELAAEALAMVGGMAVRRLGRDGGVCDVADALLLDLAEELRLGSGFVTLPSATEYMNVMSEVVRVRFPGDGMWDLPIAIHEFGHFAMPRIGARKGQPVKQVIERERAARPAARGRRAEELWCDVFATFLGGPAYAYALVARADPTAAHVETSTHPSPATRVVAVLRTIDELEAAWSDSDRSSGSLQPFRDGVDELWRERAASAKQGPEPSAEEGTVGAELADEFLAILHDDEACIANRYVDGASARAVATALQQGKAPSPQASMLDVVNGGWLARRAWERDGRSDLVEALTETVSTTCARVTAGGTHGT